MALNGWKRLWIAVSILAGLCSTLFAFSTQPSLESYDNWCNHGIGTLLPALGRFERTTIDYIALSESLRAKGPLTCVNSLLRIETERANPAVSEAIAPTNREYAEKRRDFPAAFRKHWMIAAAIWLAFCAALWLLGYTYAWIRRGFVEPVA